uniref:Uncharacterized protein n=1 Tax=Octopus bimaculoides TaxID=37653 RepID=A0A0L8GGK8_OCTBM
MNEFQSVLVHIQIHACEVKVVNHSCRFKSYYGHCIVTRVKTHYNMLQFISQMKQASPLPHA